MRKIMPLALALVLHAPAIGLAQSAGRTALPAAEQAIVDVIERSMGGVVFVNVTRPGPQASPFSSSPLGGPGPFAERLASGSGFFVDESGLALTNYHVVEGATEVSVRLSGLEGEFPARVVGTAPDWDLAAIEVRDVPPGRIRPLPLGDSGGLRVGQRVIALGAPFGLEFSASDGIVSAVGRTIPAGARQIPQAAIQTDAAINPGNSGGPLLDSAGRVVGINTVIISPAGLATGIGQSAGVGFAIPVDVARELLPRLRAGERVTGPVLGVRLAPFPLTALTTEARQRFDLPSEGALVMAVVPGSPAAAAGLRGGTQTVNTPAGPLLFGGDVVTAVDGRAVRAPEDLIGLLFDRRPGDRVRLTVRRGTQTLDLTATLAAADTGTP